MNHACGVERTLYPWKVVISFAHAERTILEQRHKVKIVLQIAMVSVLFVFIIFAESIFNGNTFHSCKLERELLRVFEITTECCWGLMYY